MTLPDNFHKVARGLALSGFDSDSQSRVFFTNKGKIEVAAQRTSGTGTVLITLEHSAQGETFKAQTGGSSLSLDLTNDDPTFEAATLESGIYRLNFNPAGGALTIDVTVTEHD